MKKNFIFKFLISILIIVIATSASYAKSFVSLSPALTEIMYAIGAEKDLKGVSTACTYPKEAKLKEKIGDNFFVNDEKILKIKPDYILAFDSSEFMLNKYKKFGITPLCLKYQNIDDIYKNIITLGKLTGKEQNSINLVQNIKKQTESANMHKNLKILYLIQTSPMITIGRKSFITDIIEKSGNYSVTKDINAFYPTVSEEFAIKQKPDVIVLSFYANEKRIKQLFPNTKIIYMTEEENDIINRPSPRIYKSVEFFGRL